MLNRTLYNRNSTLLPLEEVVPCYQLQIIGVYCVFLFFSSLIFNILLLMAIFKSKQLQTPRNYFIATLGIINLAGTILELPIVGASAFNCGFIFPPKICAIEGFIMYFTGCMGIYILVLMSLERFFVIYKPMSENIFTKKITIISILCCVALSLVWCLVPYLGWSHYSLEGAGISCSVEWQERTLNVISYNITIFVFVYVAPLLAIAITNTKILLMIKRLIKMSENNYDFDITKRRKLQQERQIIILTLMLICGFIITWTPYALISLYVAFINDNGIPALLASIPAFFAKLSLMWPSFLNIVANREIRINLPYKKTLNKILPFTIDGTFKRTTRM